MRARVSPTGPSFLLNVVAWLREISVFPSHGGDESRKVFTVENSTKPYEHIGEDERGEQTPPRHTAGEAPHRHGEEDIPAGTPKRVDDVLNRTGGRVLRTHNRRPAPPPP